MAYDVGGLGDLSFNDSAQAGLLAAEADFRIRSTEFVLAPGDDPATELATLASDGPAVILAVGFLWREAVATIAPFFPNTDFVVLDGVVPSAEPNVQSAVFEVHESSFLVGAAAALTSTTGRVGFIGGVSGLGAIEQFQAGFAAGALAADPAVVVDVAYLSAFPDFSGFFDPAGAYAAATTMYGAGADVVYHAAGPSGIGLFLAARDVSPPQVWAIGVDSDQYLTAAPDLQPHILTSALKRFGAVVYDVIAAETSGAIFESGIVERGLAEGAVGYATSGGFVDAIVPVLDVFEQDVVDGVIVVPTVP